MLRKVGACTDHSTEYDSSTEKEKFCTCKKFREKKMLLKLMR